MLSLYSHLVSSNTNLNCSNNMNNMNKPHFCVSTFVLLFRSLKSILQMCKHFVHTE